MLRVVFHVDGENLTGQPVITNRRIIQKTKREKRVKLLRSLGIFENFGIGIYSETSREKPRRQSTPGAYIHTSLCSLKIGSHHAQAFHILETRRFIPITKAIIQRIKKTRQRKSWSMNMVSGLPEFPHHEPLADALQRLGGACPRSAGRTAPGPTFVSWRACLDLRRNAQPMNFTLVP